MLCLLLTGCPISPSFMADRDSGGTEVNQNRNAACRTLRDILSIPTPDDKRFIGRWYVRPQCGPLPPGEEGKKQKVEEVKGVINYIEAFVGSNVDCAVRTMFERLGGTNGWVNDFIRILMLLTFIIFAITIMFGLQQGTPFATVVTVVKLMVIYKLATDYEFFSFFIKDFFESMLNTLSGIVTNSSGFNGIGFIDNTLSMLLSGGFIELIFALLGVSSVGWLYGILLGLVIFFYVSALIQVAYLFITAMISRGLLYAMAPIFVVFLMFERTKEVFLNWIKLLSYFILAPLFTIAFLGVMHQFVGSLFARLGESSYIICYSKTDIQFGPIRTNWWNFFDQGRDMLFNPNASAMPVDFFTLVALVMLTIAMKQMVGWGEELARSLTQALSIPFNPALPGWPAVTGLAASPLYALAAGAKALAVGATDPMGRTTRDPIGAMQRQMEESWKDYQRQIRREMLQGLPEKEEGEK